MEIMSQTQVAIVHSFIASIFVCQLLPYGFLLGYLIYGFTGAFIGMIGAIVQGIFMNILFHNVVNVYLTHMSVEK